MAAKSESRMLSFSSLAFALLAVEARLNGVFCGHQILYSQILYFVHQILYF